MARDRMPTLRDTGRRYLDGTGRARLRSHGLERFIPDRGGGAVRALIVAVAVAAALVGAMIFYWTTR